MRRFVKGMALARGTLEWRGAMIVNSEGNGKREARDRRPLHASVLCAAQVAAPGHTRTSQLA